MKFYTARLIKVKPFKKAIKSVYFLQVAFSFIQIFFFHSFIS